MTDKIKVKKIDKTAYLPEYSLECDIAFDVRTIESECIKPLEQKEIRIGLALEIPKGYIGLIRDRFGIVSRYGMHVIAGTIDSSYREEITIMMINLGKEDFFIEESMKIAQIVIVPVNKLDLEEVEELSQTKRTGKKHGLTN
jgi:dUTP pyrophosphatase